MFVLLHLWFTFSEQSILLNKDFNFGKKNFIILFKLMAMDSEYDWDFSDDGDVTFTLLFVMPP